MEELARTGANGNSKSTEEEEELMSTAGSTEVVWANLLVLRHR